MTSDLERERARVLAAMQAELKNRQDSEELALVQRHTVNLADLYRKGKARGLLSPRSAYGTN
jgi:hypothetical protein